jgi:hypothetical protein
MSNYPETFDTTGPASLEESYLYLNWTAVSVGRILAGQPETSWELLPGLLGEKWGDLDWYQHNEWLADFYDTVYQYASSVPPVEIFAVDELGEPAADMARVIDRVVQTWTLAAYQDPEPDEQSDDEQDQWSEQDQWTGQDQWVEQDQWTTGQEQWTHQEHPETGTADQPDLARQEPLTHVDPDAARQVLARVLDDDADDLSAEDEQILATVLTVERFQYLAREFDLV